ncbi:MAG TPA: IS21 family transposase [Smithellaceae bacterium]|nr:IS21 family transposase [Smithellaceae bacterium]
MLQLRRILQLRAQGRSNRSIADALAIGRDAVNGYVNRVLLLEKSEESLLKLTDEELGSLLYKEPSEAPFDWRLADLQGRIPHLCDELKKPKTTRMILWEEYRNVVPEGYGYTQFCEHLNRFLETRKAVMHFEHDPAASMMFDFAGDPIHLVCPDTGEIIKCVVLVCTLPFSGYTYIEALASARRPHLLQALNNALEYFGGVPLSAKTDNMKQIVKKSNRYEPSFDSLAEQWSLHYNTTLMASRVAKPRDKASVESHVNAVYNRIYAPLRNMVFHSLRQINESLLEQLEKFNARNFQRCDYSRKDRFLLHEKALLGSLPDEPFIPKCKVFTKVQRNCHVTLGEDMHHYSAPYKYIGREINLVYDVDNVEIYFESARIACHRRNYKRNAYTTVVEHLPPDHQHYTKIKAYTSEYFTDQAKQVGENTVITINKILEQKIFIEQTYNSCLGVLGLQKKYGKDRLEAACTRALKGYKVGLGTIRSILEKNLDQVPIQTELSLNIPEHDNIRGSESYQ